MNSLFKEILAKFEKKLDESEDSFTGSAKKVTTESFSYKQKLFTVQ